MLWVFVILFGSVSPGRAQSGVINEACKIINSLPCDQVSQTPVCGTDGVFYPSECHFAKAQCKDTSLQVDKSMAACTTSTTTMSSVNSTTTSVMAGNTTSDSMGMGNDTTTAMPGMDNFTTTAILGMDNFTTTGTIGNGSTPSWPTMLTPVPDQTTPMPQYSTTSTVAFTTTSGLSALCKIVLANPCPPASDFDTPVCASGDVEFPTLCAFTHAQCYNPALSIVHSGTCSMTTKAPTIEELICDALLSSPCNDDSVVICGTDGLTYTNSCEFEKEKCKNPNLHIVKEGMC